MNKHKPTLLLNTVWCKNVHLYALNEGLVLFRFIITLTKIQKILIFSAKLHNQQEVFVFCIVSEVKLEVKLRFFGFQFNKSPTLFLYFPLQSLELYSQGQPLDGSAALLRMIINDRNTTMCYFYSFCSFTSYTTGISQNGNVKVLYNVTA